jgi:trigger factor
MTIDASRLQISVQEQERWRRRMSVTIPAAIVAEEERRAAAALAKRVNLKGFRKGRVPKTVVESRFGGALRQEALDKLVGQAYRRALEAENLRPISDGEIEEISYEPRSDVTFTIAFDVQPTIEIGRLGGFVVERPRVVVEDADVDQMLEGIRRQHGTWVPVTEGVPGGQDMVDVHLRKLDPNDVDATGKEYEFVLGEGQAIPDVEAAIKSLEVGATGEFDVTFPEDFPDQDRRGVAERIELTVQGRKVLELPEIDDELARQVGDFSDLADLTQRIRTDLQREATERAEAAVRGRLLDLLVEANPFEVPRSMVDRYVDGLVGEQSGLPAERMAEIKESISPEAERAVKRLLLIDRVAATQSLEATEGDIEVAISEIARRNDSSPEKVYASLQKAGRLEPLERELTERKVFDFLKSQSEITDAPAT